jgi:hypothetical protein
MYESGWRQDQPLQGRRNDRTDRPARPPPGAEHEPHRVLAGALLKGLLDAPGLAGRRGINCSER